MRILCVHGVGNVEAGNPNWLDTWKNTIQQAMATPGAEPALEFDQVPYDHLFDFSLDAETIAKAVWELSKSGANSLWIDFSDGISGLFGRQRGLLQDISSQVGWTAGMVVQWAGDDVLRRQTQDAVMSAMKRFEPDVVCAHSLGSLICYDTFQTEEGKQAIAGKTFVSIGSQIGNEFVRGIFGGRIGLPTVKSWYHVFNKRDWVFTAPINDSEATFNEIDIEFVDPPLNHTATKYLGDPTVVARVWQDLGSPRAATAAAISTKAFARSSGAPRRALLVGINQYPDAANRLEGCVNDVFLMSAVLQECRFTADEIRVVLDDRATAAGIMERLQWLLDNVQGSDKEGDQRVFFYSGHGASCPDMARRALPTGYIRVSFPSISTGRPTVRSRTTSWTASMRSCPTVRASS